MRVKILMIIDPYLSTEDHMEWWCIPDKITRVPKGLHRRFYWLSALKIGHHGKVDMTYKKHWCVLEEQ